MVPLIAHMKALPLFTLLSACFLLNSCIVPLPIIGGGVAGAGMDSIWMRRSAESYPDFVSSSIKLTNLPGNPKALQIDRDKKLHRFPTRFLVEDKAAVDFEGFSITYRSETIRIKKEGQPVLSEKLPSAFYYSGLQLASFKVHGESFLLCTSYTRSSTGMVWIGLYRVNGELMFRGTRSGGGVWDILPSANGFLLSGRSSCTEVAIKHNAP